MDMLSKLNLAIEKNPNDSTLYLERAYLFFNNKDYKNALRYYNKAIELDDKYAPAYQGRGNAFFYENKEEYEKAALDDYNKAIELDDKYAPAYIGRGNIYFYKKDHKEALKHYEKAIELDEKNAEAYKMRGDLYFDLDKKDCKSAIADYTTAIKLDKTYVDAYFERGKAHFYLKEYKEALSDYKKSIKLDEKYVYAYIYRGNLYKVQNNYKDALKDYDKAIELNNMHVDAYVNRGDFYFGNKKYKLAKADYEKAIKLDDKCIAAYTGLGNIYSNYNKRKLAEPNYRKAIEIDENFAYAHAGLGYLHYRDKKYDDAIECYNDAIRLDENYAPAYNDRGTIFYIKKNPEALADFRKAIELDDKLADAHYQCGIINYENESYQDALDDYKKARKLYINEDASFNVSLLDKRIKEITGMLRNPTSTNQKIKKLMVKIDDSDIKESIKNAKASFKEFITEKERDPIAVPEFLVLRRWNSYTPIIADKEISKGGGYFFKIDKYGIVIDPGFNFLDNFKSAGYRFQDIDHILITHAHNDHTTDLESILTLLHQYNEAILGDYDTHDEGTIMHDVLSDITNQGIKVDYENRDYIEESAKKRFANSKRRKQIRIYMTASTFKKYAPMLKLYEMTDYEVVIIKADDEIKILQPDGKQPKDLKITAIKAKHDDLLSDRDSLGFIIRYKNFVLVYTGDTGYSMEIEKQYLSIYKKYQKCDIVLLAHMGGFKEYEKKFDASRNVTNNRKSFYKNHLGRLGLAKLVEVLKPKICIISEFGEEFRNKRIDLTRIFQEVYENETFFIPADIGLRINAENKISLIDYYICNGIDKIDKHTDFYPYDNTSVCELESEASLIYYRKGPVTEGNISDFLHSKPEIRRY